MPGPAIIVWHDEIHVRGPVMNAEGKSSNAPLVAIVDDDVSVRRSTARLLRLAGLRVEAFPSAEAFLAWGRMEDVGCLLLDQQMAGTTGLNLQRHLAETATSVPIIFFSAHSTAEDERHALQAGAIQFLRKPVSKESLLAAIRSAVKASPSKQRR